MSIISEVGDSEGQSSSEDDDSCNIIDHWALKKAQPIIDAGHAWLAAALQDDLRHSGAQRSHAWHAARTGQVTSTAVRVHPATTARVVENAVDRATIAGRIVVPSEVFVKAVVDGRRYEDVTIDAVMKRPSADAVHAGQPVPVCIAFPPLLHGDRRCCVTSPDALIIDRYRCRSIKVKVPHSRNHLPPKRVNNHPPTLARGPTHRGLDAPV
eukprot:TRINITY_DN2602_c0_g1_i5.p1 TRINITY_DN2602_c0_g1~~TRINITY_DN2602_c0_g1_i5.p1  ORF type:complete len:211 (-),score=23.18 TRINITY_DN2602_c0_g1_i5:956-1588(-)